MTSTRKTALVTGVFFIITIIASVPALFLYAPVLDDPNYVLGGGANTGVALGAFLEVITAIACIGTAVTLFPILKRQHEGVALGYVAARVFESTVIVVGIISLLSVVTLRQDLAGAAGADAASLVTVGRSLVAVHDWTFLLGPGLLPGVNGLLLGYPDVPVRLGAAAHGPAGAHRRPPALRLGDRNAVRPLRAGLRVVGDRDSPGVRLGGIARHLPRGQGLQALPHHRWNDRSRHPARLSRGRPGLTSTPQPDPLEGLAVARAGRRAAEVGSFHRRWAPPLSWTYVNGQSDLPVGGQ
jgi:hypothetical protein